MKNFEIIAKSDTSTVSKKLIKGIDKVLIYILEYNLKLKAIGGKKVIKERSATTVPLVGIVKVVGDVGFQRDIGNYELKRNQRYTRLYLSSALASLYTYICIYDMYCNGIDLEESLSFATAKIYSSGAGMLSTIHQLGIIQNKINTIDHEEITNLIHLAAHRQLKYIKSPELRQEISIYILQLFNNSA